MKKPPAYLYDIVDPPGVNIHRLRNAREWTQRQLAAACDPPLDHTTIQRIERNKHYTSVSLGQVGAALGVSITELFLPPEFAEFVQLSDEAKHRVVQAIQDASDAERWRSRAR